MYSQVFELQADLLKAIAHPRRLEILHLLRDQELCVSDIYEMLDLPQANISQHLMILRDTDVLSTRKDGKQVFYSISDPDFLKASDAIRTVLINKHQDSEIVDNLLLKMKDLVPIVHDPVCDMRISPKTAGGRVEYQNKEYYFCASGCQKKFQKDPEHYVTKE